MYSAGALPFLANLAKLSARFGIESMLDVAPPPFARISKDACRNGHSV